jgi:hypothetical protein
MILLARAVGRESRHHGRGHASEPDGRPPGLLDRLGQAIEAARGADAAINAPRRAPRQDGKGRPLGRS